MKIPPVLVSSQAGKKSSSWWMVWPTQWLHGHQASPSIPQLHAEMDLIIDPDWSIAGQEDRSDVCGW